MNEVPKCLPKIITFAHSRIIFCSFLEKTFLKINVTFELTNKVTYPLAIVHWKLLYIYDVIFLLLFLLASSDLQEIPWLSCFFGSSFSVMFFMCFFIMSQCFIRSLEQHLWLFALNLVAMNFRTPFAFINQIFHYVKSVLETNIWHKNTVFIEMPACFRYPIRNSKTLSPNGVE